MMLALGAVRIVALGGLGEVGMNCLVLEADRRLVLIDAANCLYRAFFAPFPPLRTSDGTPTKAVLVFANMLRKLVREEAPDAIAVVMDPPGGSFRRETHGQTWMDRSCLSRGKGRSSSCTVIPGTACCP